MRVKVAPVWRRTKAYLEERPALRRAVCVALACAVIDLQWLQLDTSSGAPLTKILSRRPVYLLVNCAMILTIDLVILLFVRRWHWAFILGAALTGLWGLINHYVWLFSGDVLTFSAIGSLRTAANVIGGYKFPLDRYAAADLLTIPVCVGAALLLRALGPAPVPWRRIWMAAAGAGAVGAAVFFSLEQLERVDEMLTFNARQDVAEYGYCVHLVRNTALTLRQTRRPEGYDQEKMDALAAEYAASGQAGTADTYPDIILILNETFYDLDLFTDVQADAPYLENYQTMENAVKGYAVVPSRGGGTNRAEYELLTGNSMLLLNCHAPFKTLDLTEANNVVRYLKGLGYETPWAMHSYASADYNRSLAYPALGFEQVRFSDTLTWDWYGNREMTDSANYMDLFRAYLSCGEAPRLLYFLTFQNHGGYEQNDSSYDLVHTGRDFGDLTDDIDEFLTSIRLSDDAIGELLGLFSKMERPVIVCMVGDHAPSFINQLPARQGMTEQDQEVAAQATPFFIWANPAFGPIEEAEGVMTSLEDLVPTVLDIAGMPLSPYYRYMLDLNGEIPVRMSTGLYRTAAGEYGMYAPEDSRFGQLSTYYYMEYDNLQDAGERHQTLFEPPAP